MDETYHPPLALTVLSGIFLLLGAICFVIVAVDIIWRRGWQSMMLIMIPTYTINATYTGPLALYLYFTYGRAKKLGKTKIESKKHSSNGVSSEKDVEAGRPPGSSTQHDHQMHQNTDIQHHKMDMHHGEHDPTQNEHSMDNMAGHHMHMMMDENRPFWATVLIGVAHCGAGCVLGDLVGEWLGWGVNVTINGRGIWPGLLIDYGFALFFGIFFQYFSIAPMSGQYGPKTLLRAAKADFLSLTAFEIGLFGWMIAFNVGIWDYKLGTDTWTYWWMMQFGMILGYITSTPVNWYLLKYGIKEPCA